MPFPAQANTIIRHQEHTDLRALLHYISPSVWSAMPWAGLVPILASYAPPQIPVQDSTQHQNQQQNPAPPLPLRCFKHVLALAARLGCFLLRLTILR